MRPGEPFEIFDHYQKKKQTESSWRNRKDLNVVCGGALRDIRPLPRKKQIESSWRNQKDLNMVRFGLDY